MSQQTYQSKPWNEIKNVTVDGQHIQILSVIRDQAKTAAEIAAELGSTPMEVQIWLAEMESREVFQVVPEAEKQSVPAGAVSKARIDELNEALIAVVGPIAGVIMSDVLKNLGMIMDNVPAAAEDELIASLAAELPASARSGFLRRVSG